MGLVFCVSSDLEIPSISMALQVPHPVSHERLVKLLYINLIRKKLAPRIKMPMIIN